MTRSRSSARDAVHVAIMQRHGAGRIITFDDDFASVIGITQYRA